jgi:hypothetical protein
MLSLLLMLWMLRLLRRAMSAAVRVLVWIHIVTVEMVGS